jgi:hypothetical protein
MKLILAAFLVVTSLSALAAPVMCPEQGLGGDPSQEAIKVTELKSGLKILVCGLRQGEKSDHLYSKFDLYSMKEKMTSPLIYRVGANKKYRMEDKAEGVDLNEVVEFKGKFYPIYKVEIRCTDKHCKKADDVCIFKRHPTFKSDIVDRISKTNKVTKPMIAELRELALTGDPVAYQVFVESKGLKVNDEVKEEVADSTDVLKRLKKDGCL